jgi:DNA-binding CsgD family transcriptional regulator
MATRAERDCRELVAELMSTGLTLLPVELIAMQVCRTFGGAGCAFADPRGNGTLAGGLTVLDPRLRGLVAQVEDRVRAVRTASHPIVRLHPVRLHYAGAGRGTMMQTADVPERFIDRSAHGRWQSEATSWGVGDQLTFPLVPSGMRAFTVGRDRRFSAVELCLAGRIWRFLVGLDRQIAALTEFRMETSVAADMRLTPREIVVLWLLADGQTFAAMGRRLCISERTVHKHLQYIYEKLDVADRLSAVLRARDAGLLSRRAE